MTPGAHRLYSVILAASSDRGEAVWTSQATLASRCGWSDDRTVRTYLAELRAAGWVDDGHRWRRDRHSGQVVAMSNVIVPGMPAALEAAARTRRDDARAQRPTTGQRGSAAAPSSSAPARPQAPIVLADEPERPSAGERGRQLAERALRRARGATGPP